MGTDYTYAHILLCVFAGGLCFAFYGPEKNPAKKLFYLVMGSLSLFMGLIDILILIS